MNGEGFNIVKTVKAGKLPANFDPSKLEQDMESLKKDVRNNYVDDVTRKEFAEKLAQDISEVLPYLKKDIEIAKDSANNATNTANNATNAANNAVNRINQVEAAANENFTKVKEELVKVVTIEDSLIELGLLVPNA